MKIKNLLFIAVGIAVLFYSEINAQWVQTNGPCADRINSLAVNGNNIFAGSFLNGIYHSTDNGLNWSKINIGFINKTVSYIALFENNIFVGTSGEVYRSTDNGVTWTDIGPAGSVNSIEVNGSDILVSTDEGFYHSTNNGSNWIRNFDFDVSVTSFANIGTNIFAGTSYGVFLSTDNGSSWKNVLKNNARFLAVSGTSIFAGGDNGVFVSTNYGLNWEQVNNGLKDTNVYSITAKGNNILAGTTEAIYRSTDNGLNWNPAADLKAEKFAVYENNIFAGTNYGVYLSSDDGLTWKNVSNGLPAAIEIPSFAVSGDSIAAGTVNGVYLSTSSGNNWNQLGLNNVRVISLAMNGKNIFAGTYGKGIFLSTDNGSNWNQINNGLKVKYIPSLLIKDNYIYAGASFYGVFRSTDNGANWTNIGLSGSVNSLITAGNNLYAINDDDVGISTDNGLTWWSYPNDGLDVPVVNCLAANMTNIFAGTNNGVYRSTDYGASWKQAGLSGRNVRVLAVKDSNVFAALDSCRIFLSTDNGSSWSDVSNGFPMSEYRNISSLAVQGNYVFAGTIINGAYGIGAWRRPLSEMITDVKESRLAEPKEFVLEQNYPNPFNPITVISYQLPVISNVTLKVYDILGKEVCTLVNKEQSAGTYNVKFSAGSRGDGSKLSSGIYLYRLTAGGFTATKKLMLMK